MTTKKLTTLDPFRSVLVLAALTGILACQSTPKTEPIPARKIASTINDPRPVIQDAKRFLLTEEIVTSAAEMEEKKLLAHDLDERPWTSSFWPDRIGNIALRYRGANFFQKLPLSGPRRSYRHFIEKHDATAARFDELTETEIALLSPSEKYDILVGDREFSLTREVWDGILHEASRRRFMAMWSGICNGWAAAAVNLPRPTSTVVAISPHGKRVTFSPDDIKALTSLLWAHSFLTTTKDVPADAVGTEDIAFYGNRCNQRRPKKDSSGRTLPQEKYDYDPNECADPNAGVWHLAIVNRVGVQQKSFVLDERFTQVISNHPVAGYSFNYFHPRSGKPGDLASSRLKLADYTNDPFRSVRTAGATSVVGVEMRIKLTHYSYQMDGSEFDSKADDRLKQVRIRYDLELDEKGDVIGGQWRINRKARSATGFAVRKGPPHPDFMWYVRDDVKVWTMSDPLEDWDPTKPFPAKWTERAVRSAQTTWKLWDQERLTYPAARDHLANLLRQKGMTREAAEAATIQQLDALGVPKEKPYAQPLAKVVYKLIEISAERETPVKQD